jgi:hypothetical protein
MPEAISYLQRSLVPRYAGGRRGGSVDAVYAHPPLRYAERSAFRKAIV